jgi:hypothetical protein
MFVGWLTARGARVSPEDPGRLVPAAVTHLIVQFASAA